jgi:phosphatidate phosphatase APP1
LVFWQGLALAGEVTRLKADEQIAFYPVFAQPVPGRDTWRAEIRGCVFEPEKARLSVAAFREALELKTGELSAAEKEVFNPRARLFLVDHERGKRVFIRLGTNEFFVGKSGADGMFAATIEFGDEVLGRGAVTGVPFAVMLAPGDTRQFTGRIFPLSDAGVSVISDIDDTIKITEVRDREATLRNTFLREFRPAPGMAEFYQALARSNHASFHYVSASPWQLYEPLSEFARSNGFPAGTFHLKPFRWKDRSFFSLFADPVKYKLGVLEPLLKKFPNRKFILIGDSGERDPEIYGQLARKFPEQIERIYIRDVTNESGESPRYESAFREVPRARWQIFSEPPKSEVKPRMDADGRR